MKLLTTTGTFREQFENRYPIYQRIFSGLLTQIANLVEQHSWPVFAAITLWCGRSRLSGQLYRNLGHDELYTFYIAQAASIHKLLILSRTVDLHPPLTYLFARFSMAIFGASAWACRAPSALAFVATTALIFSFLKRITSALYGLIAVLFLWSFPYVYSAPVARPYSWILCFTALMLVGWYREAEEIGPHPIALLAVWLGGFGLLLSHVLGVLPFAAVVGAELLRVRSTRKYDWSLCAALLTPFVSVISYIPLIKHQSALLFTPIYHVTALRVLSVYWEPLRFVVTPVLLIVVLAVDHGSNRTEDARTDQRSPMANLPFAFLLLVLFLLPLAIAGIFARTGTAFFDRYGVVMLIPAAITPALTLASAARRQRSYAVIVALIMVVLIHLNSSGIAWLLQQSSIIAPSAVASRLLYIVAAPPLPEVLNLPVVPAYLEHQSAAAPVVSSLDAIEPNLALVAGTGLTFLELDGSQDDRLAQRLVLLTDRVAASTIAHDTLFENYGELKKVFPIRGDVQPYCFFLSNHQQFLVLGKYQHPQGWLLRKLEMDGAQLRIVARYPNTLEERDIYEVTISANPCTMPQ